MNDLRTAAQQALEALKGVVSAHSYQSGTPVEAITALRAALAQQAEPVQEPIGYLWPTGMHPEFRFTQQKRDGVNGTPVYTTPPQQAEPVEPVVALNVSAADRLARHGIPMPEGDPK